MPVEGQRILSSTDEPVCRVCRDGPTFVQLAFTLGIPMDAYVYDMLHAICSYTSGTLQLPALAWGEKTTVEHEGS